MELLSRLTRARGVADVHDGTRSNLARLARRAGFGSAPGELDAAVGRGTAGQIAWMVDPAASGVPEPPDPWDDATLGYVRKGTAGQVPTAVEAWLGRMATTPRQFEEWLTWYWHGHFVSGVPKVRAPLHLVNQIRLFQRAGLGGFAELLTAVTLDAAMLEYLDGRTSTGTHPNENYGREVMELFTLGRGTYGEDDVQAGAKALTGWTVALTSASPRFVPRRHDATPQTYLGQSGVHDVAGVVAAIMAQPSLPTFIAGGLARQIIGPQVDDATVARLAAGFVQGGFAVAGLVREILEAVVAGADGGPVVLAPVPWLISAIRATGAQVPPRQQFALLRAMGQVPFYPPNVGGWPGGETWLSTATVVGRFDAAGVISSLTSPASPAGAAAATGDATALAEALGVPQTFGPTTAGQLARAGDPTSRLVLALTSPEFVLA